MKKYRCPYCGDISMSTYCDSCEKSIPSSCIVETQAESATEEQEGKNMNELINHMKKSNELLRTIERNTSVMKVIMIINFICALISVIITVVGLLI